MLTDPLPSLLLGLALGGANAAAAYALYRLGRDRRQSAFLRIVLGGMAARLLLFAAVFALIVVAAEPDRLALTGGFLAAMAVGTAADITLIQRRAARPRPQP